MLEDKIKQIKHIIETDNTLNREERERLLALSQELQNELQTLEKTHEKRAHTIAEETHKTVESGSKESVHGLQDAVQEFEVSHPNLVRVIQALCAQFGV